MIGGGHDAGDGVGVPRSAAVCIGQRDRVSRVVLCIEPLGAVAVGGLSLEQAIQCPQYGAPLVVLGAPLTIDADSFKTADGNLEASLRMICDAVHSQQVPAKA